MYFSSTAVRKGCTYMFLAPAIIRKVILFLIYATYARINVKYSFVHPWPLSFKAISGKSLSGCYIPHLDLISKEIKNVLRSLRFSLVVKFRVSTFCAWDGNKLPVFNIEYLGPKTTGSPYFSGLIFIMAAFRALVLCKVHDRWLF